MTIGLLLIVILNTKFNNYNSLYKVGILSAISLLIHNIPEGTITSLSFLTNRIFGIKMALLIFIHNIPEGMMIAIPLYYNNYSKMKISLLTFISSLGELLGSIIVYFLTDFFLVNSYINGLFLLFTAGVMISLSLLNIWGEGVKYKKYWYFCGGILLGLTFFCLISL